MSETIDVSQVPFSSHGDKYVEMLIAKDELGWTAILYRCSDGSLVGARTIAPAGKQSVKTIEAWRQGAIQENMPIKEVRAINCAS